MASTKKQDKPTPVPEQAAATVTDHTLNTPEISGAATADPAAGGTAITPASAGTGTDETQEAGGSGADLPVQLAPTVTSTEDAEPAASSPGRPAQAGDESHDSSKTTGPNETASSVSVELNPAKVQVYPLRSFMDEGELRRRGGPSYLVPRLHAEDLERRNLVSRTPLEE